MKHYHANIGDFLATTVTLPNGSITVALVDEIGLPVRLATVWLSHRATRVRRSTLLRDARSLRYVYQWFITQNINVIGFFSDKQTLNNEQLQSLIDHLRICATNSLLSIGSFNYHLTTAKRFLLWLYLRFIEENQTYNDVFYRTERVLKKKVTTLATSRIQPLVDEEVVYIRQAFSRFKHGLRNRIMFEICLGMGLRRGELLKLKVKDVVDNVLHIRRNNDLDDLRQPLPSVKTEERELTIPSDLVPHLNQYISKVRRSNHTDYLFTTQTGQPLSVAQSDKIIRQLKEFTGIPISWHRLRHTFAETYAQEHIKHPQVRSLLQYQLGHKHPKSINVYIQCTIAHEARKVQNKLNLVGDTYE